MSKKEKQAQFFPFDNQSDEEIVDVEVEIEDESSIELMELK